MGDSRMRVGCSIPLTLFAYFAREVGTHPLSSSSLTDRCAISRPLRQFGTVLSNGCGSLKASGVDVRRSVHASHGTELVSMPSSSEI